MSRLRLHCRNRYRRHCYRRRRGRARRCKCANSLGRLGRRRGRCSRTGHRAASQRTSQMLVHSVNIVVNKKSQSELVRRAKTRGQPALPSAQKTKQYIGSTAAIKLFVLAVETADATVVVVGPEGSDATGRGWIARRGLRNTTATSVNASAFETRSRPRSAIDHHDALGRPCPTT